MHDHKEKSGDKFLDNLIETISDTTPKHKPISFSSEGVSGSRNLNKLFNRQKSVHHVLGGGKPADVLLWRNKKISSSVLVGATLIWVLFEWLEYHFLTLVCIALVIGLIVQFLWSNASCLIRGSPSEVPRLALPNELFVNAAVSAGSQVNLFLNFIQDVACGRDLKQFVMVVLGLWAAAAIGGWCNFLTLLYVGVIALHTLPVLYEQHENQVNEFINNLLTRLQHQYQKLDERLLSKIPKANLNVKKAN